MAGQTPRFKFNAFGAGTPGSITDDGQKYTSLDRFKLDRLLAAIEGHDHLAAQSMPALPLPPTGVLLSDSGHLTAGYTYHYRVALVDLKGNESIASPELHLQTPTPLPPPGMAGLSAPAFDDAEIPVAIVGALAPGYYYYAVTALRGVEESTIGPAAMVSLIIGESTVLLELPAHLNADSFRIWRMGSSDAGFTRIGVTADPTFVDDGSVPADPCACDPGSAPPSANTGISSFSVQVALPAGTVLTGVRSWRLYRSVYAGIYKTAALVHEVVERDDEWDITSPLVTTWLDTGDRLSVGQPQSSDQNMRFVPFTFDTGATLPIASLYPEFYPFLVDKVLYVKILAGWQPIGGAGGDAVGSSILTSPNGSRFLVSVQNDGTLGAVPTLFPGPPPAPTNLQVV